jgi:5'-nucleotidase|tara:strand:+ start:297 stop:542 length:246 start_codon:yes stop_codon:yes gene_type:complete
MILPFNRMNVDVSCLGNHELDISIERAMELIAQTNCPWIMSNLVESDKEMRPVADVLPYKVLENQGFKIGFLGFAEEAWLD